jgi:predicted nucleic acid-binding protein
MTGLVYLDASAILKLVTDEPGSADLRAFLADRPARATSVVGVIETRRNARKVRGDQHDHVTFILGAFEVIELSPELIDAAVRVRPRTLRTLDAIHIASAVELGRDLASFVTYDRRQADAAREAGLPVASPGADTT